MSEFIQGVVTMRNRKATGVQLDGGQQWYNARPGVLSSAEPGTSVKLKIERKGDSAFVQSVELLESEASATEDNQQQSYSKPKQTAAKQTNYEKSQEDRQRVIVFQAARNAAIEVVKAAITADALALPTKKGDKFDAIVAFVDELTTDYYTSSMGVYTNDLVIEKSDGEVE